MAIKILSMIHSSDRCVLLHAEVPLMILRISRIHCLETGCNYSCSGLPCPGSKEKVAGILMSLTNNLLILFPTVLGMVPKMSVGLHEQVVDDPHF